MNHKTLKNAVIRKIGGKRMLEDVCEHGIDGGFPGFTYYSDTCAFFRKHKTDIVSLAETMAEDMGEDPLTLVKGFRCLDNNFTTTEIGKVLYGPWKETDYHTQIGNAMAWFAAEEVARDLCDR